MGAWLYVHRDPIQFREYRLLTVRSVLRQETLLLQHLERGRYPRMSGDRCAGDVRRCQVDHCGFPDGYLWDVV